MSDVKRYDELMFSGAQTVEKHVRWVAESFVKYLEGGFKNESKSATRYTRFRAPGHTVEVALFAPAGCHGFALQMLLEEQIRSQLSNA